MSLIKKPADIAPAQVVKMLIYGQPGIGKTTVACSAKDAVLFDYDGGVNRINPAHMIPTVQIRTWEETGEAIAEIERDMPEVKTIVIDTVGKMLDFMSQSIMRTDVKLKQKDGTLSLKGYGVRKQKFIDFVNALSVKGWNVIFIAHEKEDRRGDDTVKRPEVGGSSANDLLKELDLVGYMQSRNNVRTITFNPTDDFYAKNSCYIQDCVLPVVVDPSGLKSKPNTFMEDVILGTFREQQKAHSDMKRKYHELIEEIKSAVDMVVDIDELNLCREAVAGREVIFDSKIKAGEMLNEKAKALGARYDKAAKSYVAA